MTEEKLNEQVGARLETSTIKRLVGLAQKTDAFA